MVHLSNVFVVKFEHAPTRRRVRPGFEHGYCIVTLHAYIYTNFSIFPLQLLLSDNLTVIEALATVCKDHHAELACALIQIFCHYNRVLPIVNACLAKSIKKEGKPIIWWCVFYDVCVFVCRECGDTLQS